MMNGNDTGKGLSVTYIRLLVFIYYQQFANVRWGNTTQSAPCSP